MTRQRHQVQEKSASAVKSERAPSSQPVKQERKTNQFCIEERGQENIHAKRKGWKSSQEKLETTPKLVKRRQASSATRKQVDSARREKSFQALWPGEEVAGWEASICRNHNRTFQRPEGDQQDEGCLAVSARLQGGSGVISSWEVLEGDKGHGRRRQRRWPTQNGYTYKCSARMQLQRLVKEYQILLGKYTRTLCDCDRIRVCSMNIHEACILHDTHP